MAGLDPQGPQGLQLHIRQRCQLAEALRRPQLGIGLQLQMAQAVQARQVAGQPLHLHTSVDIQPRQGAATRAAQGQAVGQHSDFLLPSCCL